MAAGTYTPGSERVDSFALKNGVEVYGGFAGVADEAPGSFDLADRDFVANETILSGEIGALERRDYPEPLVDHKKQQAKFKALYATIRS